MFMKRELGKEGYTGMRTNHRGQSPEANREAFLGEGASELGSEDLMEAGTEVVQQGDAQKETPGCVRLPPHSYVPNLKPTCAC